MNFGKILKKMFQITFLLFIEMGFINCKSNQINHELIKESVYQYNQEGQLIDFWNIDGNEPMYFMKSNNWNQKSIGESNQNEKIENQYNEKNQLINQLIIERTDKGDETRFYYDNKNRVKKIKNLDDVIYISYKNGNRIEKQYLGREFYKKSIYDEKNNLIYKKFSDGCTTIYKYDQFGNCIYENHDSEVIVYEYEFWPDNSIKQCSIYTNNISNL